MVKNIDVRKVAMMVSGGMLFFAVAVGFVKPAVADSCVMSSPTVVATPASQSGVPGTTLTYNINVTNNDSPECLNSNYAFYTYNTPVSWGVNVNPAIVYDVAPGQTTSTSVSYTSNPYALEGDYHLRFDTYRFYTEVATQVASNDLVYTVVGPVPTDAEAPTVSITAPSNGGVVAKGSTAYIWANAQDNVGVTQVEYKVNGQTICTQADSQTGCAWHVPNKKANYAVTVVAHDAAGNTSSASVNVTAK
jgi:hypothetical protein